MVTKLQSSLEQKGPATQRKGKLLLSQCLLLSSRRIKCRNKSHQRLRQFLSPREDWLTTKPRRNNFTWSKSDHRISRLRKARRLTCPRSQLMAHYEAKRKVHKPEYYGLTPHQKWMIRQLENFHIIIRHSRLITLDPQDELDVTNLTSMSLTDNSCRNTEGNLDKSYSVDTLDFVDWNYTDQR